MPHKRANYQGQHIGELTLIEEAGSQSNGAVMWMCQCSCGNFTRVSSSSLNSGHTRSCGHLLSESTRKRMQTHKQSKTRLYGIYIDMKQRCTSTKARFAYRYVDRGITVCEEWQHFEPFHEWALANGYKDGLEIDRIDNDKGYSPDNCRWVTHRENANNRHDIRFVTYKDETLPFAYFAEKYAPNIHMATLYNRIFIRKWDIDDAINRPVQKHRVSS